MKTWQVVALVAAAWAGIYLPGLGSTELKGEEARRIMPGREMLRTGDWVVPRVAGLPYSRKPPLVNWLAAASFKLTGVQNEWSGRLPSVLAVLFVALATGFLLARSWGEEAGLLASIFLLANISMFDKGRLAEIEPLYISMFGIALMAWVYSWLRGATAWSRWPVAFLFLGLGFLAKGPPHLLFFYLIAGGILYQGRRLREFGHPAHFLGWGVFAAVVLPWGLLNQKLNPQGDSGAHWRGALLSRLNFQEIDYASWLMQIPQSLINFLPWALLLPLLWNRDTVSTIATRGERAGALYRGMRWGMVCGFLIIVLLPSSRPRFSMPLMVPASVLLAIALLELRGVKREKLVRVWSHCCLGGTVAITVACAAIPFLNAELWWSLPATGILMAAGVSMARALAGARTRLVLGPARLAVCSAGVFVLAALFYSCGVIPRMRQHENIRSFGNEIRESVAEDARLAVYGAGYQPFVFYLGEGAREIGSAADFPASLDYLLLKEDRWANEREALRERYGPEGEAQLFVNPREVEGYNRYLLVPFGVGSSKNSGADSVNEVRNDKK